MTDDIHDAKSLLGEFSAILRGIEERLDRDRRELISGHTNHQSELHEIKKDFRGIMTTITILSEQLKSHIVVDDINQRVSIEEIKRNRAISIDNVIAMRSDMTRELLNINNCLKYNTRKLNDLMFWRSRILGALALASVVMALFGRTIFQWIFQKWT